MANFPSDTGWLGRLKTRPTRSQDRVRGQAFSPFSSSCLHCPQGHKNNRARRVKMGAGARNIQCLRFSSMASTIEPWEYRSRFLEPGEIRGRRRRRTRKGRRWSLEKRRQRNARKELPDVLSMQIGSCRGKSSSLLKWQLMRIKLSKVTNSSPFN